MYKNLLLVITAKNINFFNLEMIIGRPRLLRKRENIDLTSNHTNLFMCSNLLFVFFYIF